MKRLALIFISLTLTGLLSTSCSEDEETKPSFDESLIIGKWKSGTLFERYDQDNSGATWDTGEEEDVKESEAQKFTWTITKDNLVQIHKMEVSGAKIPKEYTITDLTATSLKYEDNFGVTKSFSKQ